MKRKDYITGTLILLATSMLGVYLTSMAILNRPLFSIPISDLFTHSQQYQVSTCGTVQKIDNLDKAVSPYLRKLAEYQQVCGGSPTKQLMVFTGMPNSEANAASLAQSMASTLKEFSADKITPLVVFEPTTEWGNIDFVEYHNGFYDAWIKDYFADLKKSGITDAQMGTWVPFPEANLPIWSQQNATASDVAADITKTVQAQKSYFPGSKASIMLNSQTYQNTDYNEVNGEYDSLLPYVKTIPKGLIDSFGLQGFPWEPTATTKGTGVIDPSVYLDYKLAEEAATQLGIKAIWFNTGTFGRKYTLDPQNTVTMSPEQRKDILSGVVIAAQAVKKDGYSVAVNLFAENKAQDAEATDWSYWPEAKPSTTPDTVVFADFATSLSKAGIPLWLFDQAHH
ncbi:MAG TPA: hypothetical protein VNG90_01795 [Candidatus Acidoferrum sp.]|nr:hypothetical protein [Candidatus Acidoferrum sp.]